METKSAHNQEEKRQQREDDAGHLAGRLVDRNRLIAGQKEVLVFNFHAVRDSALYPVVNALNPAFAWVVPKQYGKLCRSAKRFDKVFIIHAYKYKHGV